MVVLAIAFVTTTSFVVRFLLLDRYPAPSGADFGNYLTIVNIIRGQDVTGEGLRYPPLYFVLLAFSERVFGGMLAVKVMAALVASAPCIPMLLLSHRWMRLHIALGATFLLTFTPYMATMTAWGGSPNFLAIAFLISALYFLDRAYEEPALRRRHALLVGVMVGLVFLTHHLTMLVLGATMLIFFAIILLKKGRESTSGTTTVIAWMIPSAVVCSLPGIPTYFRMREDISSSLGEARVTTLSNLIGPTGFGSILNHFWWLWLAVFILSAAIIVLITVSRGVESCRGVILVACIVSPILVALFYLGATPNRGLAYLPIPLLLGFGLLVEMLTNGQTHHGGYLSFLGRYKLVVTSVFITLVVFLSAVGSVRISEAVNWYHFIEEDEMVALDWILSNTPQDSVFATSGKYMGGEREGNTIGWWIQGYSERKTVMSGNREFYLFQDELDSVLDMNRFFSGTHVFENGRLQVSEEYPVFHRANPEIAVFRSGQYESLLFMNDDGHRVTYRESYSSEEPSTSSFQDAERVPIQISEGDDILSWTTRSVMPSFEVSRTTTLSRADSVPSIYFGVSPVADSVVEGLSLKLWPLGRTFSLLQLSESVGGFTVSDGLGNGAEVEVAVVGGHGLLSAIQFAPYDPVYSIPCVSVNLTGEGEIEVVLRIVPDTSDVDTLAVYGCHYADEIMARYGVDYVFECKIMGNEIERFIARSTCFEVAYDGPSVIMFRVIG